MIELFFIQYILITIIAFMLTEKYPPSYMWTAADKPTKFVACMIPIYREIIMLITLYNKNEI